MLELYQVSISKHKWLNQRTLNLVLTIAVLTRVFTSIFSAYLLFGYMGIYPNVPSPIYLVASPTFNSLDVQLKTSISQSSPATLSIRKTGNTRGKYVQSFSLNGLKLNRSFIHHDEIKNGAVLEFEMGTEKAEWDDGDLPPSNTLDFQ